MESRVGLKEVAARLGISKMTVSRALRGAPEVSQKTRQRVQKVAEDMGYQVDVRVSEVMGALRKSVQPHYEETMGFIYTHPTWHRKEDAEWAASGLEKLGYRLDVVRAWEYDNTRSLVRVLETRGIRGIILAPNYSSDFPVFELPWERFTTVLLGSSLVMSGLPRVQAAYFKNATLLMRKVWELGYERPAMIIDRSLNERTGRALSAAFMTADHPFGSAWSNRSIHFRDGQKDLRWVEWVQSISADVLIIDAGYRYREMEELLGAWLTKMPVMALNVRGADLDLSGICQNEDIIAQSAARVLISWLRNQQTGQSEHATETVIPGSWNAGQTA